ncbi:hypothetical protein [Hymenobacter sp. BT523]|uniref:hypothetical protein n=1 Tax=Hymenobacter sp. BT523 TaxID=2795725 RepID=UPI0018EC7F3E|nr:hypothetical protein [Hymenobacter sp. BT523]
MFGRVLARSKTGKDVKLRDVTIRAKFEISFIAKALYEFKFGLYEKNTSVNPMSQTEPFFPFLLE